jgi:hypothetical protein
VRPLFTVHAGEFIVGEFIERTFPTLDVWIPAKDTGIDLLVTGVRGRPPVSLQVKLSRDYKPPEASNDFERSIAASGWLTLNHKKLSSSAADLWVIVLVSHERRMKPQFIVIQPAELLRRLTIIHGKSKSYHLYPWVTKTNICLEGRGLLRAHRSQLVAGTIALGDRDLSSFLGNWNALENLAKVK